MGLWRGTCEMRAFPTLKKGWVAATFCLCVMALDLALLDMMLGQLFQYRQSQQSIISEMPNCRSLLMGCWSTMIYTRQLCPLTLLIGLLQECELAVCAVSYNMHNNP